MAKIQVLINTDFGDDVDDALAIALALRSPEIEVLGIITAFKDTYKRAQMVKVFIEALGYGHIPIIVGESLESDQGQTENMAPLQYEEHLHNVVLDETPSATDFILETFSKYPEAIYVELAPMTNLARAIKEAPEVLESIKVVGMGGAFYNAQPEWNILCDPEAAKNVTDYIENLILFGLDVTKYAKPSETLIKVIEEGKDFLHSYAQQSFKTFREITGFPITLHDVVVIAYLLEPSLAELVPSNYQVEVEGRLTRGTMVINRNYYEIDWEGDPEASQQYARSIQMEIITELLLERLF